MEASTQGRKWREGCSGHSEEEEEEQEEEKEGGLTARELLLPCAEEAERLLQK